MAQTADAAATNATLPAQRDRLAFVVAVPTAELVADVREALAAEGIALLVQHMAAGQFDQSLCGRQHGVGNGL